MRSSCQAGAKEGVKFAGADQYINHVPGVLNLAKRFSALYRLTEPPCLRVFTRAKTNHAVLRASELFPS